MSFLDPVRRQALERLAQKNLEHPTEEEPGMVATALDYLGRPGAATRSAIDAAVSEDGKPWEAFKQGLQRPTEDSPTGADIADKVGERFDIQNPMALAGLATLADLTDPVSFVPGGQISKSGKVMKAVDSMADKAKPTLDWLKKMTKDKAIYKQYQVGDKVFQAKNPAQALQIQRALRKTNQVSDGAALQSLDANQDSIKKYIKQDF